MRHIKTTTVTRKTARRTKKKKEPTAADTSETEPEKIDENEKDNAETPEKYEDISSSSGPTLVIPEPEHDLLKQASLTISTVRTMPMLKKPRRFPNESIRLKKRLTSTQTSFSAVTIPRRKPEEVDDEELVRAKAKKNKFDSGYDFFDEAPKKSMGVIES